MLTRASIAVRPLHAGVFRYHHRVQVNVRIEFQHIKRFHRLDTHKQLPQKTATSIYKKKENQKTRLSEKNRINRQESNKPYWRSGFTAVSTFIDCLCDTRYRGLQMSHPPGQALGSPMMITPPKCRSLDSASSHALWGRGGLEGARI